MLTHLDRWTEYRPSKPCKECKRTGLHASECSIGQRLTKTIADAIGVKRAQVKRKTMEPEVVDLRVCENCGQQMMPVGHACIQCGHSAQVKEPRG